MPEAACDCCHGEQAPRIHLDQEGGSGTLTVCLRCLRSSMLMKAAASEQRGSSLLRQYAEEYGLHLWRSGAAVYLLPSIAPFSEASTALPAP